MGKEFDYDIIIIGAGPAGSAAAALCAWGKRVLLVDREVDGTLKECGGLLSSHAQKELGRMGLVLPGELVSEPQPFAVRAIDMEAGISRLYEKYYINLDRGGLDLWLRDKARHGGAEVAAGEFLDAEYGDEGVKVRIRRNGRTFEYRTMILAGADGACSRVRRLFPRRKKPTRYIALQRRIVLDTEPGHYPVFFDSRVTDFYGWVIPKNDYALLGVSLPEDNVLDRFEAFSSGVEKFYHFRAISPLRGSHVLRPVGRWDIFTGNRRVALLGEAAGFISPSSSEGISFALRSAAAFAKAVAGRDDATDYRKKTLGLRISMTVKNIKLPFMYNKRLRKALLLSGAGSLSSEESIRFRL